MREISVNAMNIEGQPMFRLQDRIKTLENRGHDILHFEIGDPDFATPSNIVQAAISSLRRGDTHYCSSWGLPAFVTAIQDTTERSRGFRPRKQQVLVTPGANIAISYAIFCLVNPGFEVLVPDPGFPTYLSATKMFGARAIPYRLRDDNQFRLCADDIEPLITEKTRLLIINSPQNPTGAVTSEQELRNIFDLAEMHDLYIYSDEIYARMVYNEQDFFSIATCDHSSRRVILSNGFSKAFAMTGWRLGALIGPEEVTEKMMLLLQTASSCVAPFVQMAGLEAITGEQTEVREMMAEYKSRRDLLVGGLNEISGISCHLPGGAFYAFPNISSFGITSEEFSDFMLEKAGVAMLPGSNFGEQGEGFVRICYASSRNNIQSALLRIAEACKTL